MKRSTYELLSALRRLIRAVSLLVLLMIPACEVLAADSPDKDIKLEDKVVEAMSLEDIPVIRLAELEDKPVIDGKINDAFWQITTELSLDIELWPERFSKAVVATHVRVGLTSTHLYLMFNAQDPEPDKIRSADRQRDAIKDDDYVSLIIDPTGNLRRKYEFRVNPHGSISDVLQNPLSDRYIYDWDSDWTAAAKMTQTGYQVEMEIPLDSLKQPEVEEGKKQRWLVLLKRSYPRSVDRSIGGVFIIEKLDLAIPSSESTSESKRSLAIKPYYIHHRNEERDAGESFVQVSDNKRNEAGVDIKLNITEATHLAVTLNPNYTEIEADIARDSINNSFNPFQPEKRRFFQEDMELYSTLMPIVYTRNIIRPEVGFNMAHSGSKASTGGFWVSDEETTLIMPDNLGSEEVEVDDASNSATFRYVTASKGNSIGTTGTVRTGEDYSNYVGSIDGLYNFSLDDKVRYQLMYSQTEYPETFAEDLCNESNCVDLPTETPCGLEDCAVNPYVLRAEADETLSDYALRLSYKHDSADSLYWINYFDVAPEFRGDLGYITRVDYRMINVAYGRNWLINTLRSDKGKSRIRAYIVAQQLESQGGEKIETGVDLWGEFRGTYQSVFRLGYRVKERAVNRIDQSDLSLGENAPLFDESYFQWYFETAPYKFWTFNFDGRLGDIADADNMVLGYMTEFKPKLRYRIEDLEVMFSHTYRNFELDKRTLYKENFSTLTFLYALSEINAIRLLYKYDKTDRDAERYIGEDLHWETEGTIELTYKHTFKNQLSLLTGIKYGAEDDSGANSEFTNEREIYMKLEYNYQSEI